MIFKTINIKKLHIMPITKIKNAVIKKMIKILLFR